MKKKEAREVMKSRKKKFDGRELTSGIYLYIKNTSGKLLQRKQEK